MKPRQMFIRAAIWRGWVEDFTLTGERIRQEVQAIDKHGLLAWFDVDDLASNMTGAENNQEPVESRT